MTKCSRPYIINIPNPQVGTVPLESLAPIVENKLAQITMSGATVDSDIVSVAPVVTSTSSGTTTQSGASTPIVANYCSNLGTANNAGLSMIGCADYTKGSAAIAFSSSVNPDVPLFTTITKGDNSKFTGSGLSMPNAWSSYLKYVSASGSLSHNYTMEF